VSVSDETRIAYRRELHRLKNELIEMEHNLSAIDPLAASAAGEARNAVFLAWTILATPIEDDDDH
jgi:hypothetical protein